MIVSSKDVHIVVADPLLNEGNSEGNGSGKLNIRLMNQKTLTLTPIKYLGLKIWRLTVGAAASAMAAAS